MTLILTMKLPEGGEWPDGPGVARAVVIAELASIGREGGAKIAMLESGTLELRLATGEVFHLDEGTVTRIA